MVMISVHIGSLIRQEMKRQERTVSWLARNLSCDRTNVYRIFQKDNIDCILLDRIGRILNYNFFKILAEDFDANSTTLL